MTISTVVAPKAAPYARSSMALLTVVVASIVLVLSFVIAPSDSVVLVLRPVISVSATFGPMVRSVAIPTALRVVALRVAVAMAIAPAPTSANISISSSILTMIVSASPIRHG